MTLRLNARQRAILAQSRLNSRHRLDHILSRVKRADPDQNEYVSIEAGDSKSVKIDLSNFYSLSMANECVVKFRGRVHDVLTDTSPALRTGRERRMANLVGNTICFRIDSA